MQEFKYTATEMRIYPDGTRKSVEQAVTASNIMIGEVMSRAEHYTPSLRAVSYEERRLEYFKELKKHEENRIQYWMKRDKQGYCSEAADNLAEAGEYISFIEDALEALKK